MSVKRLECERCGKFLRCEAYGTVVGKFYCPDSKCKHVTDVKRIVLDAEQNLKVKFDKPDKVETYGTGLQKKYDKLKAYTDELERYVFNEAAR